MTSERATKAKKVQKIRPRFANDADTCGVPLPAIVIRTIRVPAAADGTTADAPLLLYPHRPAKNWVGRDATAGVLKPINNLLAVYSIVALQLLQAKGGGRPDAVITVESAAALSITSLEKAAREQLQELTAFDNNDDVVAWANHPTNLFRIPVYSGAKTLQQASLAIVSLLQRARSKASGIQGAVHETQLSPADAAGTALVKAFGAGARLSALECHRVAEFADINPAPIWREHAQYAHIYELGRFVGRVDRGAKAVLTWHHHDSMQQALDGVGADEDSTLARMYEDIRSSIELHFGAARFRKMIAKARRERGTVVADRRSRRLRCRRDTALKARVFGREPKA